jgi:uncharacterized protein with PIN domain
MTHVKFIADVMVGKLARWLRTLGFDTAYSNRYLDDDIVTIAEAEGRVILTRDTGLAARRIRARCILIESGAYEEQIRQVLHAFDVDLKSLEVFSRCIECNFPLSEVEKESIAGDVPPYVYRTQERFARCSSCGRVYWRGTHVEAMTKRLRAAMESL